MDDILFEYKTTKHTVYCIIYDCDINIIQGRLLYIEHRSMIWKRDE